MITMASLEHTGAVARRALLPLRDESASTSVTRSRRSTSPGALLTRRNVDKQQDAETEGGEEA